MKFEDILGKTLTAITETDEEDEIHLTFTDGKHYKLFHEQDCCESVLVEDICGNLLDLIGAPLIQAEESTNFDDEDEDQTWTFYRLATIKGSVTIRWSGRSDYYSTAVDFVEVPPPNTP